MMNKRLLLVISVLVLFAGACNRSGQQAGGAGGDVAARVNGKDILRSEVESQFAFRVKDAPQKPDEETAALMKIELLRDIIEGEVMAQKAAELKLTPADAEIDARLKLLQGSIPDADFEKTLSTRGVKKDDLRKEIARTITVEKVVESQVKNKAVVTDQDITDFFNKNREAFNIKETLYKIGVIAVTPDPNSPVNNSTNDKALNPEMAIRKMQTIEARAKAGEDFSKLARELSEDSQTAQMGGDLGYQPESSLERFGPEFKSKILTMKVGDLVPLIRTPEGLWLFKLTGKREPGQHDLSNPEVKQNIKDELEALRGQLLSTAFSEQLHNQARIENFLVGEVLAKFNK
jgi:peptidyl-prolyl cis-trans isomerase SurA